MNYAMSRQAFVLEKYNSGTSPKAIAKRLNVPIAAVEFVLSNAGLMPMPDMGTTYVPDTPAGGNNSTRTPTSSPSGGDGGERRPAAAGGERRPAAIGGTEQQSTSEKREASHKEKLASESAGESASTAPYDEMEREFPPEPWMQRGNEMPTMSMIGAQEIPGTPETTRELEGVFAVPNIYRQLFYALTEFGARPELARGIIRIFRYYQPDDYVALDEIMRDSGISPQVRRLVIKAWKLSTREEVPPSDNAVNDIVEGNQPEREVIRQRINQLKKDLGITKGNTMLDTLDELEKEKVRLEIEEMRQRLKQAKQKAEEPEDNDEMEVMVKIGGIPTRKVIKTKDLPFWKPLLYNPDEESSGDDTVEVMLDIHGTRVRKRIKLSELEKWKPYIVREDQAQQDDLVEVVLNIHGMPIRQKIRQEDLPKYAPWIKGETQESREVDELKRMIAEMNDKLEKERKEYEEKQREAQRRAELDALRNEISRLRSELAEPRGPSEADKRVEELRQMIEKQRDEMHAQQMESLRQTLEAYRSEMQQLRGQLDRMNSYEYVVQQQQRLSDLARKVGFIPKDEARQIQEEDVEIQDRLNAVKRKDEAQAEALHIAADKLKSTGRLRDEVISRGGAEVVVDALRKLTTSPEQANAPMYTPSPEELARAVERMEGGMGSPVQPQPPPNPPQQPPEAATQGGIPGYRPIVPEQPREEENKEG